MKIELPPHAQRMIDEADELSTRLTKLRDFINGEMFKSLPGEDQLLLASQCGAMTAYFSVLTMRLIKVRQHG